MTALKYLFLIMACVPFIAAAYFFVSKTLDEAINISSRKKGGR